MQDESQLISELQSGNDRAFSLLYDKYSGSLYYVILKMTKNNEALAQDLLQDTFISIWNKCHQYDPNKGRFYTWAYRIARHKVLNYFRSQKELIQSDISGVYKEEDNKEQKTEEKTTLLKGAVSQLEVHHRSALELVYFNGLTHKEAHKVMDVPLGTFKSYIRQALKELRKHYKLATILWMVFLMIKG